MSEFEETIQALKKFILNGGITQEEDWTTIMEQLVGSKDVQTIDNIYKFVDKYFSFKIENGAEGYVYFGEVNAGDKTRAYQVIGGIVDASDGAYGYISSTEAGKLFNDTGFMAAVKGNLRDSKVTGENIFNVYDGNVKDSVATGIIEFSDGTTVQAFNDFFSVNYVKNLECSNVSTLLSGDKNRNCFSRTEFEAILCLSFGERDGRCH